MSQSNKRLKSLSLTLGATFVTSLAASNIAGAATPAGDNPFAMSELSSGYMLLADKGQEGKCGEGKCGGKAEEKGRSAEGQCGGKAKEKDKSSEGKGGEGKCGGSK